MTTSSRDIELINSLGIRDVSPAKKYNKNDIRADIKEAVEEMKLIKAGKKKARNAEGFLNELLPLVKELKENPEQGTPLGNNCHKIRLSIEADSIK